MRLEHGLTPTTYCRKNAFKDERIERYLATHSMLKFSFVEAALRLHLVMVSRCKRTMLRLMKNVVDDSEVHWDVNYDVRPEAVRHFTMAVSAECYCTFQNPW